MSEVKGYVIQEKNWEYNDEYYYEPEGGGGTALTVYHDKAKAYAECDKLNIKWAHSDLESDMPSYAGEDVSDKLCKALNEANKARGKTKGIGDEDEEDEDEDDSDDVYDLLSNFTFKGLNDEQTLAVLRAGGFAGYEVDTVDFGD